jgi:hypothetical protein
MKHKTRQQILCFMTNSFNKNDFIENQAKLDIFDNFFDMLERSLTLQNIALTNIMYELRIDNCLKA